MNTPFGQEMASTLSVFFNTDKTYVTVVEPSDKALELKFINATDSPVDLENFDGVQTKRAIKELREILSMTEGMADKLSITIPPESIVVSQFPGSANMDEKTLRQLISLEIRNAYPQFNPEQFSSNLVPIQSIDNTQQMLLATILPREIIKSCFKVFDGYSLEVDSIEISQLNAHSAYLYNYPEKASQNAIFVSVGDQFMDVSILKGGKPAYYNLVNIFDTSKIGESFEEEYNNLIGNIVDSINCAYFFGLGLTKDIYLQLWETAMLLGIEVSRLNAFRMIESNLNNRTREYCSRTQHIYPPCIGASFPAYHQTIKLY